MSQSEPLHVYASRRLTDAYSCFLTDQDRRCYQAIVALKLDDFDGGTCFVDPEARPVGVVGVAPFANLLACTVEGCTERQAGRGLCYRHGHTDCRDRTGRSR